MISKPAAPNPRAHRTRVVLLAALVPALLLTLDACGSPATTPSAAAPNRAGSTPAAAPGVVGRAAAVTTSTITVNGVPHDSTTQAGATPAARQQTLTVDSATRYTTTTTVPATALKVGMCVAARGPSNDLGTVRATSISVFPAGPDGCVMFGNRDTTTGGSGTSNV